MATPEPPRDVLRSATLEDVVRHKEAAAPDRRRTLLLEHSMTVGDALEALAKQSVLSAPLMIFPTLRPAMGEGLADEEGPERATFLGFVDALDLLSGLIAALPPWVGVSSTAWRRALEAAAPAYLARRLVTLQTHGDGEVVWEARLNTSLLDIITRGFLGGLSLRHGAASRRVTHRVAVFDERGTITHIVSQSDVVRFLAAQPGSLVAFGAATVASLGLGHARGAVACAGARTPAVEALAYMLRLDCSALGVVDDAGALVGNLSASDLRGVVGANLLALAEPAGELCAELRAGGAGGGAHPFFRRIGGRAQERERWQREQQERERERARRSRSPSPHRVEEDVAAAASPRVAPRRRLSLSRSPSPPARRPPAPVLTCGPDTPFAEVVSRLAHGGVHRIYVVDDRRAPTGVITLTDVLKAVAAMEVP